MAAVDASHDGPAAAAEKVLSRSRGKEGASSGSSSSLKPVSLPLGRSPPHLLTNGTATSPSTGGDAATR